MLLTRCLASLGVAVPRSAAAQRLLHPSGLLPLIAASSKQTPRTAPARLAVFSTAAQPYWSDDTKTGVNVYSGYTIYKGKGAMSLKVIKPTWESVSSGLRISREGVVLLEFAHATGTQQYDWNQKQTFALSALECASVLEVAESRRSVELFHDPNKGSQDEGTITKSLTIKPASESGWFFTLNVNQQGNKSSHFCNATDAEMRLIRTLFQATKPRVEGLFESFLRLRLQFLMPRLLGFDEHFQGTPVVAAGTASAPSEAGGGPF